MGVVAVLAVERVYSMRAHSTAQGGILSSYLILRSRRRYVWQGRLLWGELEQLDANGEIMDQLCFCKWVLV